jgi:hypothetical protein
MPRGAAQRVATAQRRTQAVQMRLEGATYEAIAEALGYSGRNAAYADINRALEASVTEQRRAAEVLRQEELLRLDLLWSKVWEVLAREHVTVSNGRLVRGDNGQPLRDDGPVLQAVDRLLRIMERRTKYLGLDAPTKHEVLTLDAIDRAIQELNAELGGDEADPVAGTAPAGGAEG